MNAIDERACGKPGCDNFGKPGLNIVGHGWCVTTSGRRRRYRCTVCGGTLSRCFRHHLLLPRPYLVLTKPLRLDIQCQRGASVKIGWKYLDD